MPIKEWGKLKVQSSIQQAHLSQSHSGKSKVRNVEEDGWAFLCLKKLRVTRFRLLQALVLIFLVQSFSLPVFSSPLLSIKQEQQKEPIESALVQRTIDFNIPQQRADLALTLFAEQANLTLVFPFDDVREKVANQLVGQYSLQEAAKKLLAGTGLIPSFGNQLVLTITTETMSGDEIMNRKRNILASTIAFFVGAGGVQGVLAQEDVGGDESGWLLEEVVVTASRREEKLQDVGMAVTSFQPDSFTNVGLTSLNDVISYTPGVTLENTSGFPEGVGQSVSVRGISPLAAAADAATATVGVYLDGVPLTSNSPFGAVGNTFDGMLGDVERVEFLKGPQGTLYGSTSLGGVIRYVTRKPSLDEHKGELAVGLSNTNEGGLNKIYNGRVSVPLVEGKLGLTVAGFYEDNAGLVDRLDTAGALLKENADAYERFGVSGDLYYEASDRLDFRVRAIHQKTDLSGTSLVLLEPGVAEAVVPFSNITGESDNALESTFFSGTLEYNFSVATLTSTSAYVESSWTRNSDSSSLAALVDLFWIGLGTTTEWLIYQDVSSKKFTQELQLTSEGDSELDWIVGFYYADEETSLVNSGVANPGGFNTGIRDFPSEYKEYAAFGNLTYHFTEKLDFTVGARVSDNELTRDVSFSRETPLSNINLDFSATVADVVDTYSFTSRYRPSDELSLYARVASGYRPGSVDVNGFTGARSDVKSDSLWSYEIGAKGASTDGFISYDIAVYYIDWEDFQANLNLPTGTLLGNAEGGVTSKGFEGSVVVRPVEGLSLSSAVAYTDASLNQDEPLLNGVKGQAMPTIPEWTFSTLINYDFSLSSGVGANLGAGVRYADGSSSAFTDGASGRLGNIPSDSYVAVDVNGGLSWDRVSLSLYVTNLLNEEAFTSTLLSFGTSEGVSLRPRTIGARLSMDF